MHVDQLVTDEPPESNFECEVGMSLRDIHVRSAITNDGRVSLGPAGWLVHSVREMDGVGLLLLFLIFIKPIPERPLGCRRE